MRTRAVNARSIPALIGSAIVAIVAATLCGLPAASPAIARSAPAAVGSQSSQSTQNSAGSPSAWSRLWWNRDQQGERMLESGDAAGAAQRFRDPQRRAYADLQAGRYAEAAQLLAPFKDPESQYNRGNALARAGALQAALAAYDAALARAPGDRDARHNRDLVARALTQQSRQAQQGSAAGTRGGSQAGGGAGQARAGQSGGNQTRAGRSGSGQSAGENAQNTPRPGSGAASQPGAASQSSAAPQSSVASQSSAASQSGTGSAPGAASKSGAVAERATPGSAVRAGAPAGGQADAQTGTPRSLLAQARQAQAQRGAAGTGTPQNRPPSEQALSLDQWLRRLPDDPGGLLRRKFLIEHLMRQQDQQQEAQ